MKNTTRKLLDRALDRRRFLGSAAAVAGAAGFWSPEDLEAAQSNVRTASKPSDLKITDLRVAMISKGGRAGIPVIRIDTNQGLVGWGEVRDGGSKVYALMLKSRLLGENPCNVDKVFRKIKQFGHHARQAGGVCGVEMALWDLAGKAYNVPCYQLLGGKFRDSVRIYADTTQSDDPKVYAQRMRERMASGLTYLKMDLGIGLVEKQPGTVTRPIGLTSRDVAQTQHMFTGFEITPKGIQLMADYVAAIREVVGMDVPLAADHFGHIGVNSCIRLGKALENYNIAWLEDMIPWQYTQLWKQITDAVDIPTLTGEDIYLKEPFKVLCETHAVDIVHPDLASSGGLLETKKIGDMAQEYGVAMAMHFAGTPISFYANVHCAAATENFLALEHHSLDTPWWDDLVKGPKKPIVQKGFIQVPETPGLGVELNEEFAKTKLTEGGWFEPTEEWGKPDSWDRLWSMNPPRKAAVKKLIDS
jgi:L-alanine-DL-glutamate epimerase-like enolase superfamily enzyme